MPFLGPVEGMGLNHLLCRFSRYRCGLLGLLAGLGVDPLWALPNEEAFDYTAGATLTTLNGGNGWAGAWTVDGLPCTVRATGLSWTDSLGQALMVSGQSVTTAAAATSRSFRLVSTTPIADCWISFLWHLPGTNAAFEGVSLYQGTTARFTVSNPAALSTAAILLGVGGSGTANPGVGVFGRTHFIVLRLRDNAGSAGADLVEMYVDPVLSAQPTAPAATVQGADLSFSSIRVAAQNGAAVYVDEIRFGSTYAAVTPHASTPNIDPDNDGLTTADEALLDTDPNVSNAALFAAIRQHPDYLGLFSSNDLATAAPNGVMVPRSVAQPTAPVPFFVQWQSSDSLTPWSPAVIHRHDVSLPAGKAFLRVTPRQP